MTEAFKNGLIERWVPTGITAIILGMIMWVGTTVADLKVAVAVLQEQMTAATSDRYTSTDAKKDMDRITERMNHIEKRLDKMEMK